MWLTTEQSGVSRSVHVPWSPQTLWMWRVKGSYHYLILTLTLTEITDRLSKLCESILCISSGIPLVSSVRSSQKHWEISVCLELLIDSKQDVANISDSGRFIGSHDDDVSVLLFIYLPGKWWQNDKLFINQIYLIIYLKESSKELLQLFFMLNPLALAWNMCRIFVPVWMEMEKYLHKFCYNSMISFT